MRCVLVCGCMLLFAMRTAVAEEPISLTFYTEDYPPFNFNYRGTVTGINTELLEAVVDELGYQVRFEVVPWGRAQRFTQTQSDTCFFSAARTAQRELEYQWVGPLSRERVQLFSLDPNHPRYDHFSEVTAYRIGGQTADAYTDWAESQGLELQRIAEIPVNLTMLANQRVDLWLAGSIGGPFIASRFGKTVYPVVSSEPTFELWMACSLRVPEFVVLNINLVLQRMQFDGTLDRIMENYF